MVLDLLLGCLCVLDMNMKDVFKNTPWLGSDTKTATAAKLFGTETKPALGHMSQLQPVVLWVWGFPST